MRPTLDHVALAVRHLDSSVAAYTALLGRSPSWRGAHPALGTRNALYRLEDTYLELLAAGGADGPLGHSVTTALGGRDERAFALALGVEDADRAVADARARGIVVTDPAAGHGTDDASGRVRTWRSASVEPGSVRGLRLLLIEHTTPLDALALAVPLVGADVRSVCRTVDHVVVFSEDLDASLVLWTGAFGLACAWRIDFPERATRNAGLDLGGVTLELIERTHRPGAGRDDVLWGVAYRVADCARAVERVRSAGSDADDPRAGLTPGTSVSTVRWQRTASLLIEGRLAGA